MKRTILQSFLKVLLAVAAIFVIVVAVAAWSFYRRALQVSTFAKMQTISAKIASGLKTGRRSPEEFRRIVSSVGGGKDSWGNEFLFDMRDTNKGFSYVLISRGSDGRLDLGSPSAYFDLQPCDIQGQYPRDIVFRDGIAITDAGK
jgi:hypothetical protein